ncbi:hypothetical protein [Agromyces aureus]|nr:hypothetical protein [Agromyces aureus]
MLHEADTAAGLNIDLIEVIASWGLDRRLGNGALTRIEGFLREASVDALSNPVIDDVVQPLIASLDGPPRTHALAVLARWADEPDPRLRAAAGRVRSA